MVRVNRQQQSLRQLRSFLIPRIQYYTVYGLLDSKICSSGHFTVHRFGIRPPAGWAAGERTIEIFVWLQRSIRDNVMLHHLISPLLNIFRLSIV